MPICSVKNGLMRFLLHVKPEGSGCCFLHTSIAYLQAAVLDLSTSPCRHDFVPVHDFQCEECYAVCAYSEDGADNLCRICGAAANPGQIDSESSYDIESSPKGSTMGKHQPGLIVAEKTYDSEVNPGG